MLSLVSQVELRRSLFKALNSFVKFSLLFTQFSESFCLLVYMNLGPIFYNNMDAFANNKTKIEYGRGNALRTPRTLGEVRYG